MAIWPMREIPMPTVTLPSKIDCRLFS